MHMPPTPAAPPPPSHLHSTLTQTIYERFNAAATAAFKIIFLLSTHVFRVSFFSVSSAFSCFSLNFLPAVRLGVGDLIFPPLIVVVIAENFVAYFHT